MSNIHGPAFGPPSTRPPPHRTPARAESSYATRALHPNERIYTFWVSHEAHVRNAGFPMDFLLLSAALAPRLARTGVDADHRGPERANDHAPVWIELSA